jgi:hypothetical protein
MALKAHVQAKISGTLLPFTAATAGAGDTFSASDRQALVVLNGSGSAVTVTVVVPGSTKYGQADPDVPSVSIPASQYAVIGPFPEDLEDDSDGLVHVTYSSATSVQIALLRI